MSSFAVDGLVSGLDTTKLIGQLMQLERIPQQRLQATLKTQTSSVSAYQSIATRLKAVDTAITALQSAATWGARSVSVTGTSVSATAAAGAVAGQNTIEVKSLATAATWTAPTAAGLGDTVVSTEPPTLTVRNSKGDVVSVDAASGSMRDVMDAINKIPDSGLTAVAVKVGTDSYRLQVRATSTGAGGSSAYLGGLDVPPQAVAGTDATYAVNGLDGSSTSNTVADLLPGVTATFTQVGTSTVSVASNQTPTSDAVKSLVDEVNKTLDEISKHTVSGANGGVRGVLAGDAGTRNIASDLLGAVSRALGDGVAAQVGVQTTKEGRLTFDAEKFATAYAADPAAVKALVAPATGVGIASRLHDVVTRATDPVDGTIKNAVQGRERVVKDLENQIESWDRRLEVRQGILSKQFSGLEVMLGRLQSQGSWLAGQLNTLNASSGS